jgi:hypothetical protein
MSGKRNDAVGELLHAFVKRIPKCGQPQLVRLVYLTDLYARQFLGKPITDLEYIYHDNGPFDSRILIRLSSLVESGAIKESRGRLPGTFHYASQTKSSPSGLSERQIAIVEYVIDEFGSLPARNLVRVVNETSPVEKARWSGAKGKPLAMDLIPDCRELFEDIRRGIIELDAGQGVPFVFKRKKTPQSA